MFGLSNQTFRFRTLTVINQLALPLHFFQTFYFLFRKHLIGWLAKSSRELMFRHLRILAVVDKKSFEQKSLHYNTRAWSLLYFKCFHSNTVSVWNPDAHNPESAKIWTDDSWDFRQLLVSQNWTSPFVQNPEGFQYYKAPKKLISVRIFDTLSSGFQTLSHTSYLKSGLVWIDIYCTNK